MYLYTLDWFLVLCFDRNQPNYMKIPAPRGACSGRAGGWSNSIPLCYALFALFSFTVLVGGHSDGTIFETSVFERIRQGCFLSSLLILPMVVISFIYR
jgi:hypothetical protein